MSSPPVVACTLTAADQGRRKAELESGLAAMVEEVLPLADGYALRFGASDDVRGAVDEFLAFERECCGFMTFEVRDAERGGLWLDLRGPEGTVDFLREWIPDGDGKPVGWKSSLRIWAAAAGGVGALFAFVCCATPLLAAMLALLGFGASAASIAPLVDAGGVLLLVAAAVLLAFEWRARRRQPACDC